MKPIPNYTPDSKPPTLPAAQAVSTSAPPPRPAVEQHPNRRHGNKPTSAQNHRSQKAPHEGHQEIGHESNSHSRNVASAPKKSERTVANKREQKDSKKEHEGEADK